MDRLVNPDKGAEGSVEKAFRGTYDNVESAWAPVDLTGKRFVAAKKAEQTVGF